MPHRPRSMFGPDFTFLGVPAIEVSDLARESADVVILGAPFDAGTSHRPGARFGPNAIRAADCAPWDGARPHLALRVDPLTDLRVVDGGDIEMPPGDTALSMTRLREAVTAVLAVGAIPVVLGGDHTVSLGTMRAVAAQRRPERTALLHFDAHADTDDTQFGLREAHGTQMRRLVEEGTIHGRELVQIGLRGYWPAPPTLNWMAENGLRAYEMTEIGARGLPVVLAEAMATVTADTTGVYLSVDIDVADPAAAPGTGTPEPGGFTSRELLDAVRTVAQRVPLVGVEIVEVSPAYDHAETTAYLANRVILEALSGIAWRRTQIDTGTAWQPELPLLHDRPWRQR
ncbi:agmatinase [Nocardia sp. NPDC050712]|uniref:agmatinase n=1 Tax=Nocardia sp. NPDC050712 TaxID=3155518 RepID=UPI00340662C2